MRVSLEPPFESADPAGMRRHVEGLASQVRAAVSSLEAQPWPRLSRPPSLVAVAGLGGSAIAADLTRAALQDEASPPLLTVRDYRWPAWVGEDAFLVLSSYSGNTEETLALAEASTAWGASRLAMTSGGRLADWCRAHGVPTLRLPPGYPPRAAVATGWVLLSELLARVAGATSRAAEWLAAADQLDQGARLLSGDVPEAANPAKQLAHGLHGRLVLVYAVGEELLPLAVRWKQQLNENAKMPCFAGALPEANHNEIEGWGQSDCLRGGAAVVFLRSSDAHPRVKQRVDPTRELLEKSGVATHVVEAQGGSRVSRLASLLQWGDYVSLYLAYLAGVDPTPVGRIESFKRRMAEVQI